MTNIKLGLIIVFLIAVGAYFYPGAKSLFTAANPSDAGTVFSTARIAQVNIDSTDASATSTGILNTDSFDRIVESAYATCSGLGITKTAFGVGLADFHVLMATGTTQQPVTISNTNAIFVTIATTSPDGYTSSTTMETINRVWATGTYMNFALNATNTAACSVGVHYIGS